MPYETGGRADKMGNRYEHNWIIYELIDVLREKVQSVTIEALGDEEEGVDLWVTHQDGTKEAQQCKGRNGSMDHWTFGAFNKHEIWEKWKAHLDRNEKNRVAIVSPLCFEPLEDLILRSQNTNGNPDDFIRYQINSAGSEVKKVFFSIGRAMDVNPEDTKDIARLIGYLSRMQVRQYPDSEAKKLLLERIDCFFASPPEAVYNSLLSYITTHNILGKPLDSWAIHQYLREQRILLRDLAQDSTIYPKMTAINEAFDASFFPFQTGIVFRNESRELIDTVFAGQSVVLHGKAGSGKSGCIANLLQACRKNGIPYIAVKLDKRLPKDTVEAWSASMGLPASIALCLDVIAKDRPALMVLDQLDAVRWTSPASSTAMEVCMQLISQVRLLNETRKRKITMVAVCRTFDLKMDAQIRRLLGETAEEKPPTAAWKKIEVNMLSDSFVQQTVGHELYYSMPKCLKELLRTPSNLYIWQHLEKGREYAYIKSTPQLVQAWWDDIGRSMGCRSLNGDSLSVLKERMVKHCLATGECSISKDRLGVSQAVIDFLESQGIIVCQARKISFVHQSVLDCLLAERMAEQFEEGKRIEELIGPMKEQNPGRRYQTQLFLQQLLEESEKMFLSAGEQLLAASGIRFSFRMIFLEILSQIDAPAPLTQRCVLAYAGQKEWKEHFLFDVIAGNCGYTESLCREGVMEAWFCAGGEDRLTAIRLLCACMPDASPVLLSCIERHIFEREEEKAAWQPCFRHDIAQDSDRLFGLRLKAARKDPESAFPFVRFKEISGDMEMRAAQIIAAFLERSAEDHSILLPNLMDLYPDGKMNLKAVRCREIIETLLPCVPKNPEEVSFDWSFAYHHTSLERVCVDMLKKANGRLAEADPSSFLALYGAYRGTGCSLHNELVLSGMLHFPLEQADSVISYIMADSFRNAFERTSGSGNALSLAKLIVCRFAPACSSTVYQRLEREIIHYRDEYTKKRLEMRVSQNRQGGERYFRRYWGDFQLEMLPCLPPGRAGTEAKALAQVLHRAWEKPETSFFHYDGAVRGGFVSSPVARKELSPQAWRGIISRAKLNEPGFMRSEFGANYVIDHSLHQFAVSFGEAVKKRPQEMLNMVLALDCPVHRDFIVQLYYSLQSAEAFQVSGKDIESLVRKYPPEGDREMVASLCWLVEKNPQIIWPDAVIEIILSAARSREYHPAVRFSNKEAGLVRSIRSGMLNSVKGAAALALGKLMESGQIDPAGQRQIIRQYMEADEPTVRLASVDLLLSTLRADEVWACGALLELFQRDARMAGHVSGKNVLRWLYRERDDRAEIREIILKCFFSQDDLLIETGGHLVADLFVVYGVYDELLKNCHSFSEKQTRAVIWRLIRYFEAEEFREKAKEGLLCFLPLSRPAEQSFGSLFHESYLDAQRDEAFILRLIESEHSGRLLRSWFDFLSNSRDSLLPFGGLILAECRKRIEDERDGASYSVPEIILRLYDEASKNENAEMRNISTACLDLWDELYEKDIGSIRSLTRQMMNQ